MKEGEGTPGNLLSEAMDVSNPLTNSVLAVASGIAAESNCSTTHVINEQAQALHETEANKKKAANEKLAASFGMNPEEFKVQQEQYRKLESENEQRFEPYPGTISLGANGDGHHYIASGQGDEGMQEYYRSSGVNRGWTPSSRSPTYEENQSVKVVPLHQRVQNLEVGDTVVLVDPPGYGTIRWIGKFPGLNQDIAGVELVSCMIVSVSLLTCMLSSDIILMGIFILTLSANNVRNLWSSHGIYSTPVGLVCFFIHITLCLLVLNTDG